MTLTDYADMFDAILDSACVKLEKKSADLILIYLDELDARLACIEKILSGAPRETAR
jgi:hypothetical protein